MFKKSICILLIVVALFLVNGVCAVSYGISNSTDSDTISKMIDGTIPIKDGKYIKNGDVVKFTAGNYKNLKLVVNKRITLTTTEKDKNKVLFVGSNSGTAILIKSNKIRINGLKFKNYDKGISGKTKSSRFTQIILHSSGFTITGSNNKIVKNKLLYMYLEISGKSNTIHKNKLKFSNLFVYKSKNIVKKNKLRGEDSSIRLEGSNNQIISNIIKNTGSGIIIRGNKNKFNT